MTFGRRLARNDWMAPWVMMSSMSQCGLLTRVIRDPFEKRWSAISLPARPDLAGSVIAERYKAQGVRYSHEG